MVVINSMIGGAGGDSDEYPYWVAVGNIPSASISLSSASATLIYVGQKLDSNFKVSMKSPVTIGGAYAYEPKTYRKGVISHDTLNLMLSEISASDQINQLTVTFKGQAGATTALRISRGKFQAEGSSTATIYNETSAEIIAIKPVIS